MKKATIIGTPKGLKKWIAFPWYIFLMPLFYLLHAYNSHFGLLSTGIFLRYIFYYLTLSFCVFLIAYVLFRNNKQAGCWTAVFLCIFFFFGASYDFAVSRNVPRFFLSYKFLVPIMIILLIFAAYLMRKKRAVMKLNSFFLILFVILFAIEIGTMAFYIVTSKKRKNDLAGNNGPINLQLANIKNAEKPDIFFIIFDEYTSSKALKKYMGFDNKWLDSSLQQHGFYTATNSQSNYNSTPLSIASTLDMQYFNKDLENAPNDGFMLLRGAHSVFNSTLPGLLENQGYRVINCGLIDIKNHPVSVTPAFPQYEIKVIDLETLWGRIRRDLYPPEEKGSIDTAHINRNWKNYTDFIHELHEIPDNPRFVTGHILLPHRPAWLDRNGIIRSLTDDDYSQHGRDSLYLEQVRYTNILIDSLARIADRPRQRPLVLIIAGDHGNRNTAVGADIREKQFMILNTYYFSDRNYSLLYDNISPVNTFRVVLNKYFNARLPLLTDSTVLLR